MSEDKMENLVLVRLRQMGKPSYFDAGDLKPNAGDVVIVEQDKGFDYGMIMNCCQKTEDVKAEEKIHRIDRLATPEDLECIEKNKAKIKDVYNVCVRKVTESGLNMKLIEGEYSFDRTKIILYFSAEGRIDFRNLVKDLAHIFRVRIELKQVGVRDEARLLGGYGQCGRALCCVSYLKDFKTVTMKMAKDQNMPLNPSKISGACGRLMCCLEYEHDFYKCRQKHMPKIGDVIKVENEKARVIGANVFDLSVTVQMEDGRFKTISYATKENSEDKC